MQPDSNGSQYVTYSLLHTSDIALPSSMLLTGIQLVKQKVAWYSKSLFSYQWLPSMAYIRKPKMRQSADQLKKCWPLYGIINVIRRGFARWNCVIITLDYTFC